MQVAEEIREDLANYLMVFAETDKNPRLELKLTVSIGLAYGRAGFMDSRGPSLESLYEHCVAALYEAQHPGSNSVNVAELVYD
jgi:GGDEF domain-containing protein